jgi:outer membrane protein OmpA-like peptidoglycan-associated protein
VRSLKLGLAGVTFVGIMLSPFPVTAAGEYETTDFAGRSPTKDELIDALKPPYKTRGLKRDPSIKPKAANLDSITFEFNSDKLTEHGKTTLNELGAALTSEQLQGYAFDLQGHTDAVGTPEYNLALSKRRADAVKRYLTAQFQIDSSRLKSIGKGESDLKDPTQPASEVNRRVQIVTKN